MTASPLVCLQCEHVCRPCTRFCTQCGVRLPRVTQTLSSEHDTVPVRPKTAPAQLQLNVPMHPQVARDQPQLAFGLRLGATGRYKIEQKLGNGAFGQTYLARDLELRDDDARGRLCVVKRLYSRKKRSDYEQAIVRANFAREARLLVSLNEPGHSHIPDIYEFLPDDDCLVMKYIAGQNIQHLLDRRTDPLPELQALHIIRAVCDALVYMHGRTPEPVLHRDIKPENLLLGADGRVWLIDFGLAKGIPVSDADSNDAQSHSSGTYGFAPPEQWNAQAEPRSDVFALGATLWTLLTNKLPPKQTPDIFPSVAPRNADVHPTVEHLIQRMTAHAVVARPTAVEALAALDRLIGFLEVPAPPQPTRPPESAAFVGRTMELQRYTAALQHTPIAMITGLAGVGKTALAAALARAVGVPQRTFWYSFHEGEGLDGVIWNLAAFLAHNEQPDLWTLLQRARQTGGQPPPSEVLLDYAVHLLHGQHYLLCLDDFQFVEHEPGISQLVRRLRAELRADGQAMIITSRHLPTFATEDVITPLAGLAADDARALLQRRGVVVPESLLTDLVARTEGNVQLLLLAGMLLGRGGDPARVITRLAEAADVERYLLREVDRHLDGDERAVMGAVAALLTYGGTRPAIETVLEKSGLRRILNDLWTRHLLTMNTADDERIYGQHAIVQAFYYDTLSVRERRGLHQRAAQFYATEAPDALKAARHALRAGDKQNAAVFATNDVTSLINAGQARALATLLAEFDATRLDATQWVEVCLARGAVATLLGNGTEAQQCYATAITVLDTQPATLQTQKLVARACWGMGTALEYSEPQTALAWLQRGLAVLDHADPVERTALLLRTGSVLIGMGSYASARTVLEESLALLPEDTSQERGDALTNLGVVYCSQGDVERGMACYEQALTVYQASQNYWKMLTISQNIGIEKEIAGHWSEAAHEYDTAFEVAERLGSSSHQTRLELSRGVLALNQGRLDDAYHLLSTCLQLARDYGLSEYVISSQSSLAELCIRQQAWEQAAAILYEAEQLANAMNSRWQLPEIHRAWAQVCLARGDVTAAHAQIQQSLDLARELESTLDQGIALRIFAQVLLATGQHQQALDACAQSLKLLDERDPYEAARTRAQLGEALLTAGEDERGRTLLGTASETFQRLGAQYDLVSIPHHS